MIELLNKGWQSLFKKKTFSLYPYYFSIPERKHGIKMMKLMKVIDF